jgi:hypothetical protein
MGKKIMLAVLALTLNSQFCLAQAPKHSAPVISHWVTDPITGSLHTLPFQDFALSPKADRLLTINWQLPELALRLSDLHRGTPLKTAAQRMLILGGRKDGGLQRIPATRYYFNPGIIVEIPVKDGVLTGPLRISPGAFAID